MEGRGGEAGSFGLWEWEGGARSVPPPYRPVRDRNMSSNAKQLLNTDLRASGEARAVVVKRKEQMA